MVTLGTRFHSRFAVRSLIALAGLAALLCIASPPALAQGNDVETPVRPSAQQPLPTPPVQSRLSFGLFGGMELPMSMGEFSLTCDLCAFSSVSGMGAGGGLFAEYALNERWSLAARLGYASSAPTYTLANSGDRFLLNGEKTTVDFERKAAFEFSAATAFVAARWQTGLGGLSLVAGPQLTFVLSNNVRETERILTAGRLYQENGTNQYLYYEGEVGESIAFQKMQIGLRGGISYDIPFGDKLVLAPEVTYLYSIIGPSPDYKAWKLGSLNLTLVGTMRF